MTEAQARLWMLGEALKYMQDNALQVVTPEVEAHVINQFMPIETVDNTLLVQTVKTLETDVQEYL